MLKEAIAYEKMEKRVKDIVENKELEQRLKAGLKVMSSVFIILSVGIFMFFTLKGSKVLQDLGEISGVILGVTMAFEMLLWFATQVIKRLSNGHCLKILGVQFTKLLQKYHKGMGLFSISALLLHYSLTFNIENPFGFYQVTGYLTSVLVLISVIFSIPNKKYRKQFKLIHIVTAFAAVIPFGVHLLG